jgi:hypothetical protein
VPAAGRQRGAGRLGVVCELVVLHDYTGQLSWLRVVSRSVCGGAVGALFVFRSRQRRAPGR